MKARGLRRTAKTLRLTGINLCSSRSVFVPALVAKRRHVKAWDASPRRETIFERESRSDGMFAP